jgi:glyoxylase-like metal-dependent hydrolase (beta-lactamase superfamily II)
MRTRFLVLIAVFVCLRTAPAFAQDFSKVEIKTIKVAGNIYMLQGAGGNIGVSVGPDGILIVDDQYAPLADKIKAALKNLGDGKLKFILNTHYHGDHTGGNPVFGQDAPIISQTNARKRLTAEQQSKFFGWKFPPMAKEGLPVITFDQSVSVFFNGEEIKVIHFPHGHTDGDSIVFFTGTNVVHMGDDFFQGRFPVVDLENGGDVEGMAKNVGEIISKLPADVKIIPGHGALSDLDGLKSFHRMLVETTAIVRKKMKAHKTLGQIKAEGLPDEWKAWGEGFIKTEMWLTLVYTSLSEHLKH